MAPLALDLFSGAGGASVGLQRAGFKVLGIDIKPQPRYRGGEFLQGDALDPPVDLDGFDFIWASPPCQRYTRAQNASKNAHAHPDHIPAVRALLQASKALWAIENVQGAPLINPAKICGLTLGLGVKRHRFIESNFFILTPPCVNHPKDYWVVFGHQACRRGMRKQGNDLKGAREAMGISWMNRAELSEAVPPQYSELVGRAALAHMGRAAPPPADPERPFNDALPW